MHNRKVISLKKLCIVCLSLILFSFPTHAMVNNEPLIIIAHLLQEELIPIEKWEVVIKEKLTTEQVEKLLTKNEHISLKTASQQAKIYELNINNDSLNDLDVQLKLIVPRDQYSTSELIAVIKHHTFNDTTEEQYEIVKSFLNDHYFTRNAHLFACVKLNSGAIIIENDFFEKLQQIFQVNNPIVHSDSINDKKIYEIVYGKTPLFTESLRVNGHSMNVHLVKRIAHNQETAFFIGTPILLNEY